MGLLDDAIREHLELKRRRGADPGEVARQESEALGPVRRGEPSFAEASGPVTEAPEAETHAPAVYEPAHDEVTAESISYDAPPQAPPAPDPLVAPAHEEPAATEPPGEPAPPPLEAPPAPPPPPEPAAATPPPPEPATAAPPPAPRSPEPRPHGDVLDPQRTREFDADDVTQATTPAQPPTPAHEQPYRSPDPAPHGDEVVPADEEGEDVLDQTPDFLQETPEHDRLWFEQKPPKDFDF